jgi:voltage-gated potassium channel
VDLLAILPTYLSVLVPGSPSLMVVRAFRLLRIFRVLKLTNCLGQAEVLRAALHASRQKITVFLVDAGARGTTWTRSTASPAARSSE